MATEEFEISANTDSTEYVRQWGLQKGLLVPAPRLELDPLLKRRGRNAEETLFIEGPLNKLFSYRVESLDSGSLTVALQITEANSNNEVVGHLALLTTLTEEDEDIPQLHLALFRRPKSTVDKRAEAVFPIGKRPSWIDLYLPERTMKPADIQGKALTDALFTAARRKPSPENIAEYMEYLKRNDDHLPTEARLAINMAKHFNTSD